MPKRLIGTFRRATPCKTTKRILVNHYDYLREGGRRVDRDLNDSSSFKRGALVPIRPMLRLWHHTNPDPNPNPHLKNPQKILLVSSRMD